MHDYPLEPTWTPQIVSVCWDKKTGIAVGTRAGEVREIWVNHADHAVDLNGYPIVSGQWQWPWPRRTTTSGYKMSKGVQMSVRPHHKEVITLDGPLLSVFSCAFEKDSEARPATSRNSKADPSMAHRRRVATHMRQEGTLRPGLALCCSPDGRAVAVGQNGLYGVKWSSCVIFDCNTLQSLHHFRDAARAHVADTTAVRWAALHVSKATLRKAKEEAMQAKQKRQDDQGDEGAEGEGKGEEGAAAAEGPTYVNGVKQRRAAKKAPIVVWRELLATASSDGTVYVRERYVRAGAASREVSPHACGCARARGMLASDSPPQTARATLSCRLSRTRTPRARPSPGCRTRAGRTGS